MNSSIESFSLSLPGDFKEFMRPLEMAVFAAALHEFSDAEGSFEFLLTIDSASSAKTTFGIASHRPAFYRHAYEFVCALFCHAPTESAETRAALTTTLENAKCVARFKAAAGRSLPHVCRLQTTDRGRLLIIEPANDTDAIAHISFPLTTTRLLRVLSLMVNGGVVFADNLEQLKGEALAQSLLIADLTASGQFAFRDFETYGPGNECWRYQKTAATANGAAQQT